MMKWFARKGMPGKMAQVVGKHYLMRRAQDPRITNAQIFREIVKIHNRIWRFNPRQADRLESAIENSSSVGSFTLELVLIESNTRIGPHDIDSPWLTTLSEVITEELRRVGIASPWEDSPKQCPEETRGSIEKMTEDQGSSSDDLRLDRQRHEFAAKLAELSEEQAAKIIDDYCAWVSARAREAGELTEQEIREGEAKLRALYNEQVCALREGKKGRSQEEQQKSGLLQGLTLDERAQLAVDGTPADEITWIDAWIKGGPQRTLQDLRRQYDLCERELRQLSDRLEEVVKGKDGDPEFRAHVRVCARVR